MTERPDLSEQEPAAVETAAGPAPEEATAAPDDAARAPDARDSVAPDSAAPVSDAPDSAARDSGDAGELADRVAELTGDLQRLQAEYLNYKRRVERDRDLVLQNAKFSILSALLPVLDDVGRARDHGELEGGFKAVAESLERIVAGEGLVRFGETGDEFDPRLHEALTHSRSPDVTTTSCDRIVQAGYRIGERVVRPALVTVVDPVEEQPQPPAASD